MAKCLRPGCNEELKTGSKYCSRSCAAADRGRKKSESKELTVISYEWDRRGLPTQVRDVIPEGISKMMSEKFGDDANTLLSGMAEIMLEDKPSIPTAPTTYHTYGDQNVLFASGKAIRPGSALDFDIIDEMLKCGAVLFVMEMKLAAIMSVWRNDRSWSVESPDEELKSVIEANLRRVLPRMMLDVTRSSLTYGASFSELVWEMRTKYELGISDTAGGKEYAVARVPKSCNPSTIDSIKINEDGSFNGFVQKPRLTLLGSSMSEIHVPADQALVIPYNGKFRNLWGESYLKPLYPIWFWYEVAMRAWVRFMERQGTPVAVCYAPSRAQVRRPGTNTLVDAMTWGLTIAGNISKSNAAVLPSDVHPETGAALWRLEYLSSGDKGDVFTSAMEILTQMMIRAGLSADRSLTQSSGGTGSYNIGEIHNAATQGHNELILIEQLAYMNEYFVGKYAQYNSGENGPPAWIVTEGLDPSEKERIFKLLNIGGNSASFQDALMRIDWKSVYEVSNIPTLSDDEFALIKKEMEDQAKRKQREMMEMSVDTKAPFPPKDDGEKQERPNPADKEEKDTRLQELVARIDSGDYIPIIMSDHEMNNLVKERQIEKGESNKTVVSVGRLRNIKNEVFQKSTIASAVEGDSVALSCISMDRDKILLFNKFHDAVGRFSSKTGGLGGRIHYSRNMGELGGKAQRSQLDEYKP